MQQLTGPRPLQEELELVARMRAGSERAFEMFVDCYLPGLLRFARHRIPEDRELARDIAQSTLCVVIERLASFRGEASLRTWMYACCRNEIAAHFRRMGRRPREVELDEAVEWEESAPGPEGDLLIGERADLVHEALERMAPMQARAMEWRYIDGLGVDEIARRLEGTYKAAESLLSRARAAFRRQYERLAGAGGRAAESEPGRGSGEARPGLLASPVVEGTS